MNNRGFTLLEILVVISMLAIVAASIVISFGGQSNDERTEEIARRFQVAFTMVSDYAVLNQQSMGLHIDGNAYCFVYLNDEQRWQQISEQKLFAKTTLPEDFTLQLQVDDLPWVTEARFIDDTLFDETNSFDEIENEDKEPVPQILILASGEITPFRVTFTFDPPFSTEATVSYLVDGQEELPLQLHVDEDV